MPQLDEIKVERGISPSGRKQSRKFIWLSCPECGRERWVDFYSSQYKDRPGLCHSCATKVKGEACPSWKGGRKKHEGYILVKLYPDNFFYPMASKSGYVLEHRLVVAKRLGRCLHPWEMVHHKDHIKDHNNDENLQLILNIRHRQLTLMERELNKLVSMVMELKQEVRFVRLDNKLLREVIEKEGLERLKC